jgi:hypothetical protein
MSKLVAQYAKDANVEAARVTLLFDGTPIRRACLLVWGDLL